MKKIHLLATVSLVLLIIFSALVSLETKPEFRKSSKHPPTKNGNYIVLAWNDLGMHCANKYFGKMAILPPYNNQRAQIIKVGDALNPPQIDTAGFYVTYEVPGNSYSVGKTDFWTYAPALFGVNLPDNVGLTGVGLTGFMNYKGNAFYVDGIPLTPYPDNDLVSEHPFQQTLINAYSNDSTLVAYTKSVIPVSNELSCVKTGCHGSEQQILDNHPAVAGYNHNATPMLCASCHPDNALGMAGNDATLTLSEDMHRRHSGFITTDCYQCHPGPNTVCFRDTMCRNGTLCIDCHGTVLNVANTIMCGRQPWLQEPECGNAWCHGSGAATEPNTLYKNSRGHGGLFCSACHGSPHGIVPTRETNDNWQNMTLQDGSALGLWKCDVCHGVNPTGPGPHDIFAASINHYSNVAPSSDVLLDVYPNPVIQSGSIPFNIKEKSKVKLGLYDLQGKQVRKYLDQHMVAGSYLITFNRDDLEKGVYYCVLQVDDKTYSKKVAVMN